MHCVIMYINGKAREKDGCGERARCARVVCCVVAIGTGPVLHWLMMSIRVY